jgi:nucleoid DNA-binding protein
MDEATNQVLRATFEAVEAGLDKGGKVRLLGLSTLTSKATKARTGRNPKTGESVAIEAGARVKFTPSASLKARLNRR